LRPRSLALRAPRSQDEWDRLHAIRKTHIFDLYHPPDGPWPCEYDPAHPDDRDPANRPLLLFVDGEATGTLRLDLKPDGRAVVRLVALEPAFRGGGLGGAILNERRGVFHAREDGLAEPGCKAGRLFARDRFQWRSADRAVAAGELFEGFGRGRVSMANVGVIGLQCSGIAGAAV
jgi:GNAT superfamily N-acetyltransferase